MVNQITGSIQNLSNPENSLGPNEPNDYKCSVAENIIRAIPSSTDSLVSLSQVNIENTFRSEQITYDETVKAINVIKNKSANATEDISVKIRNELLRKALVALTYAN